MIELLKEFVRKPAQWKFLPVFAALLQVAVFTPLTHKATSVVVPLMMAFLQLTMTGKTVRGIWKWAFIAWAAIAASCAVLMVFTGSFLAAAVWAVWALYPFSVLFTQPVE